MSSPSERPSPPVVAVVDDDVSIRSLFSAVLEREGFAVRLAANGRAALELAHAGGVDVMLLDLQMPEIDGLEVLRMLRADPAVRRLPVILVTGSAAENERIGGLESGADDVLVKPVSIAELVARVRAQIRGRAELARDLEIGREQQRQVAALLPELPLGAPLLTLAVAVVEGLPSVLDVDGAAILTFRSSGTRCLASSLALRSRFPAGRPVRADTAPKVASRAREGPWIETAGTHADDAVDLVYVPFSLGADADPVACLVYGQRRDTGQGRLSHRLPDLVDATNLVVTVLRPAVEQAATTDAALLAIRRTISQGRFRTALQPIVRLRTGETVAVEALTRFDDAMRPDVRFAEAARLGMGLAMERAAIASATEAARNLQPDVMLCLNVSPDALLNERELPSLIHGAGRVVVLEVTEHDRIDDYTAVRAAFERLGSGVRLAVDDAGSGYASLRHILALRPAYVKLDIEWVRGIDADPVRRALVSGLAYFARETGCELIAEGIERDEERAALLELGVELGQGFLLYPPG